MERIIWLVIMIPVSSLFTGLGIYAWKRREPMWFWSGSEVKAEEIRDIPAYNRANGMMWLAFSVMLWCSTFLGVASGKAGGIVLIVGCLIGVPALPLIYTKIYSQFKVNDSKE